MPNKIFTNPKDRITQLKKYNLPSHFILSPKDLIEYGEGSGKEVHWWYLLDLMYYALKKAQTSYAHQLIESSIFYSIIALEYGLKIKKCRILSETKKHEDADNWLINSEVTLGTFTKPEIYNELGIQDLSNNVIALNKLRSGLFHFNWKKLKESLKELSWDFSEDEKRGWIVIYPNLINDTLAINTNNLVIELLEKIFLPSNKY